MQIKQIGIHKNTFAIKLLMTQSRFDIRVGKRTWYDILGVQSSAIISFQTLKILKLLFPCLTLSTLGIEQVRIYR